MKTEYEIRVLEIDEKKIIERLKELGAKKVGEWLQKRYVYDTKPKEKTKWFRLRTNSEKTTLTYKSIEKESIDGTKELEIEVSNFEKTNELLELMGYKNKAYQENRRIRYKLDNVEIDIDTWPLIPSYIEIEGKSENDVKDVLKKIDVKEENITTLNCEDIYLQKYGIDIENIKELKF